MARQTPVPESNVPVASSRTPGPHPGSLVRVPAPTCDHDGADYDGAARIDGPDR